MESNSLFEPQYLYAAAKPLSSEEKLEKFLATRPKDEPLDTDGSSISLNSADPNQVRARDLLVYGFDSTYHRHLFDNQIYVFINCYLAMQWCIDVLGSDLKSRLVSTDLWIRFLAIAKFDCVNISVWINPENNSLDEQHRELVIHISDFFVIKDGLNDSYHSTDPRYQKFEHVVMALLKLAYDSHSVDDKVFSNPRSTSMFVYLHYMRQQEKRNLDGYVKNSEVVDPFLRLHGADERGFPIRDDKILSPKTIILGDASGTPLIIEDFQAFMDKSDQVKSNVVGFKPQLVNSSSFVSGQTSNALPKNINDLTNPQQDQNAPRDVLRARLQQKLKSTRERH